MGVFSKLQLSCQQASILVSKSQETKISFKDKLSLKAHLMVCSMCNDFKVQTDSMLKAFENRESTAFSSSVNHEMSVQKKEAIQTLIINKLESDK